MEKINKDLTRLGYDEFFETNREKLALSDFPVARVIAEHRGAYELMGEDGELKAKIMGKQMFDASSREDFPAVGDWVAIKRLDSDRAIIHRILPRKSMIARKHGDRKKIGDNKELQIIGTNVDVAFIVESVDLDFSLNRFERYLSIIYDGGVEPVIVLNKIDLISKEEINTKVDQLRSRFSDIDVILTSTVNEAGLEELREYIASGKTYCFLGSSGVGKSSLINKLIEEDAIKTNEISEVSGRGRHTTTSRELYFLKNGGIVMDNPGMREIGVADSGGGIKSTFVDISDLATQCKYADCTHTHEAGCAVLAALNSGELDSEKYSNYINLSKENEYYEMTKLEQKEKDRQFGKFLKKAKKDIKKYKY